ncbi:MAG: glycosyltransferase family 4 protein [Candidatus Koribacter versatilis]|uniref:Glycosyltransferase family 4 protein n=1 Tax=Candidatus Korobacter versatilis TaxID=658062 RepID=A0A932ER50_9BACT|nr:glycosyltransferase family 4 protein [Candidatus Koribacter versatilis]
MRIALVASPFIAVPPTHYGGTELFIAQLAEGLQQRGLDVVVYTNGESTVKVERRALYPQAQWPIAGEVYDNLKDLNHASWALRDAAAAGCDLIHVNNVPGIVFSRFVKQPVVYTMHHPHVAELSEIFEHFPKVQYVTISDFQRRLERVPRLRTIHHGLDFTQYQCGAGKRDYLAFIGRIAPVKGPDLAIAAAKKAGIPLKIAGEVQPVFRAYFEREVLPQIDGKFIQYIGEVDMAEKNELLAGARALLFPIQWDEPFGLVMIEAMACGTPVLALPGGSVPEVVNEGVSGHLCRNVDEMADHARHLALPPAAVRADAEARFSIARMVQEYQDLYAELLAAPGAAVPADLGEAVA